MLDYQTLKIIHIVSSTLLFGTGLGSAFFMFMTYRTGRVEPVRTTAKNVVLADYIFTFPAVGVQFITGAILMQTLGIPFGSLWFVVVIGLFCFIGALWLPVVWVQIQLHKILQDIGNEEELGERFHKLMRIWMVCGAIAFPTVLVIFVLMVKKPWLGNCMLFCS